MRKLFILSLLLAFFSCKKNEDNNAATIALSETHWNLHYKYNNTFNFFAVSNLYFKQNNTIDNYRNFDTISGAWSAIKDSVTLNFSNGEKYTGTAITDDSISGTLTAIGNTGVWYAVRN